MKNYRMFEEVKMSKKHKALTLTTLAVLFVALFAYIIWTAQSSKYEYVVPKAVTKYDCVSHVELCVLTASFLEKDGDPVSYEVDKIVYDLADNEKPYLLEKGNKYNKIYVVHRLRSSYDPNDHNHLTQYVKERSRK